MKRAGKNGISHYKMNSPHTASTYLKVIHQQAKIIPYLNNTVHETSNISVLCLLIFAQSSVGYHYTKSVSIVQYFTSAYIKKLINLSECLLNSVLQNSIYQVPLLWLEHKQKSYTRHCVLVEITIAVIRHHGNFMKENI